MGTQFFQPVSYGPPAEGGWQLLAWMSYRWLGSSSPVPKGEGPGAPSFGLDKVAGTGATRQLLAWMSYRWLGSSSPVPKGEGPGAPSFGLDKVAGTGATRRSFTSSDR